MPQSHCKELCKYPTFPTKFLTTQTESKKRRTAVNYNHKHKAIGLARCKNCDYITAEPVPGGTRCKCCSGMLSRSVYHRDNKQEENLIENA